VTKEGEMGGVSSNAARSFDHLGGAIRDGLRQLDAAIKSMNTTGEGVAGIFVGHCSEPHLASGNTAFASSSLEAGQRLTDVEAERGIEGQRTIVKRRLDEPYSSGTTIADAIHDGLHKQTANPLVLGSNANRDGSNAANYGALVKAVAPDNLAVDFRHNAIKARV
jgi:hypothetical protein